MNLVKGIHFQFEKPIELQAEMRLGKAFKSIIVELLKTKVNKILKAAREKQHHNYRGTII